MNGPIQPWVQYYDAFIRRVERIPADAFDRRNLLYSAAHDAYEATTNSLTTAGWDAEKALMLGRMFGSVVKQWVEKSGDDVQSLQRELKSHFDHWDAGNPR
jgi:hypothetical protein